MIIFKQNTIFKHESEYGQVTRELRLSDKHIGLYEASDFSEYVDTSGFELFSGDFECNGNAISGFTRASQSSVLWAAHGLANGTPVYFENVGDPVPDYDDFFDGQNYIVSDATTNDFKVVSGVIETDIFLLDKISRKVQKKVGGLIQSELKLDFDERDIDSVEDLHAVQFIQRVSPSFKIFSAVFSEPSDPPIQGESLFVGVVQTQTEDTSTSHSGNNYAINTNPIRSWKVTSKPTYRDLFDAISMDILINGDEDLGIDAIDSTWETENVANRPGWYSAGNSTWVHGLVSLNKLLRKLADQLELALTASGYGEYNIEFDRCILDGEYFPARWNHIIYRNHKTRYIYNSGQYGDTERYLVHSDEGVNLAIDPDGDKLVFGGTGLNDMISYGTSSGTTESKTNKTYIVEIQTADTIDEFKWTDDDGDTWTENIAITGSEQILADKVAIKFDAVTGHTLADQWTISTISPYEELWIDYKLIKAYDDEPSSKSAKERRWENIKSFSELMAGLAFNFGIVLEEYYSDDTTIHEKFVSRANFNGTQVYIRNAMKETRKISAIMEETKSLNANSSYMTNEGEDQCFKIKSDYTVSEELEPDINKQLILTIGTPTCAIVDGVDGNIHFSFGEIPLNTFFVDSTGAAQTKAWQNAIVQNNSIYMRVDQRAGSVDEHTYYFTHAAQLALNISEEEKAYTRLSDYLNYLEGRDKTFAKIEKSIEVDYWNAFSVNVDGSDSDIQNINIGSTIVTNDIEYASLSIDIDLKKPNVKLKCEAAERYNIINPVVPDLITPIGGIVMRSMPESDFEKVASGSILALDIVSLKSDGTVEKSLPLNSHKGRLYGIALMPADDEESLNIRTFGTIINDNEDWNYSIGKNVYIRNLVTVTGNLSQNLLTEKTSDEDVIAIAATAVEANKIEFDFRNQPRQYLLQ